MPRAAVALVLNATFEPLCVVSARRAVVLCLSAKAICIEDSGQVMHSATDSVPIPAVIRLARYVRVPYLGRAPLSRRAVFARDHGRCVYCGHPATSIDHVVPRSRGGTHTWDNVVAACRLCNHRKADRSLADLGWHLDRIPRAPSGTGWRLGGRHAIDECWEAYLEPEMLPAVSA